MGGRGTNSAARSGAASEGALSGAAVPSSRFSCLAQALLSPAVFRPPIRFRKPVTVSALQQDTAGNVYLAGYTGSTQGSPPDFWDAFVAKLSSAGTVLFWTTFGGSKADYVRAMAIAPDGSISVVGSTASLDFPLTPDAAQTQFAITADGTAGFFVRLDITGKVRYSSYLNTNYAVPLLSGIRSSAPLV